MIKKCQKCEKDFETRDKRQKFCSLSCASKYNNEHFPRKHTKPFKKPKSNKIERSHFCECGIEKSIGYKRCLRCRDKINLDKTGNMTLKNSKTTTGPSMYTYVRKHAKRIMKFYSVPKRCVICGYDKYVEICHIISVFLFNNDSLLKEINDLSNIVYLCPNHHKEFDKLIMKEEERLIVLKGSKNTTEKM